MCEIAADINYKCVGVKVRFLNPTDTALTTALFSCSSGVIAGAKITEYLLEKSRIVTHAAEERNYHVFYELLKGLRTEDKERYGLTTAENYFYLNQVILLMSCI